MARSGARTRIWLGGLAFSGVVLTHLGAFVMVAPDAHHRAELLAATGHGSWTLAVAVALASLVMAFGGVALRIARRDADAPPRLLGCWLRLALLQMVGFAGLEFAERALVHGAPWEVVTEPVFGLGLALQVVAAAIAAVLLVVFARVLERIVSARAVEPGSTSALGFPALDPVPPRFSVATGAGTLRGPPLR